MQTQHATPGILATLFAALLMSAGTASAEDFGDCQAYLADGAVEDCTGDDTVARLFAAVGDTSGGETVIVLDDHDCLIDGVTCTDEQQASAEAALLAWDTGLGRFTTDSSSVQVAQFRGCVINVGYCYGGCIVNVGACYGGPCVVNVGYCGGWGGCVINVGVCRAFEIRDPQPIDVAGPRAPGTSLA